MEKWNKHIHAANMFCWPLYAFSGSVGTFIRWKLLLHDPRLNEEMKVPVHIMDVYVAVNNMNIPELLLKRRRAFGNIKASADLKNVGDAEIVLKFNKNDHDHVAKEKVKLVDKEELIVDKAVMQSDESVMVKGNGTIFLAGPPLVKATTGEEVSTEDLEGATFHYKISGVADYFAQDELHGLTIGRNIVRNLHMAAKQGIPGV